MYENDIWVKGLSKLNHRGFLHFITCCALPPLDGQSSAHGTKPGKPGSERTEVPFVERVSLTVGFFLIVVRYILGHRLGVDGLDAEHYLRKRIGLPHRGRYRLTYTRASSVYEMSSAPARVKISLARARSVLSSACTEISMLPSFTLPS